ncbi:c-type cytochrome biogenesis protein CcmI [Oceanicella actignis]|uniref:Cytochrome c-type biogenesis protein CcmH n=1 Tax=Oceanicella actignis TaxID=1189325 RepID=A0A1M7TBJ7_9RHOB|nr:c-type cytochrome biogenesis protein CcmI [Oceanicella actignis]SET53531.1 cytochrome c-type biogenesis protein CcmH [Oceanicella actignis]SHN68073.1 cytochrome c-type biogenesis protein CcmH [Oceanicella actignis]
MIFWLAALAGALLVAALTLRPLLRREAPSLPRAAHDVQVFKDQLAALARDVERGVIPAEEAEGARAEISRRLLAAAAEAERQAPPAPAPRRVSRLAAAALALVVAGGAAGIYWRIGAPGLPDQPLAERFAQMERAARERPSQDEVARRLAEARANAPAPDAQEDADPEAARLAPLVERLRAVLEARPDDLRGHRLLVGALRRLGRHEEALAAQRRVMELLGDKAGADDHAELAELMILAVEGYVSPEAEAEIRRALELDPAQPMARFYAALTLAQSGRADLALPIWAQLVRENPDAPYAPAIRAQIAAAAKAAGLPEPPLPPAAGAAPGPTREDMQAAAAMSDEERRQMIEGMVARLNDRLAEQGGSAQEWARLIGALAVLGRKDEARAALERALAAHGDDAQARAALEAAADRAGIAR